MEATVYNPQKGRLETIEVEFTNDNTTWFSQYKNAVNISMITDFNGDILISDFAYTYPFRIYDTSRADIGYDKGKARQLRSQYE
jgi:hypothetical protein